MARRIRQAPAKQREWQWGSRYDPLLIELWAAVTFIGVVFFIFGAIFSEPDWLTLVLVILSIGCLRFVTKEALRKRKRLPYRHR